MKQVGKSVGIIIAVLCIVFFIVGFLGLSTSYGDVTTDIINGVHLVPRGFGFEKELSMFLAINRAEDDTADIDYKKIQSVYEKRLELSSAAEYDLFVDTESEGVFIKIPLDSVMQSSVGTLANSLTRGGKLEVREGREVDENGKPIGVTAENVILTNEHIKSVQPLAYTSSSGVIYYLEMSLTREGQKLLRERAAQLSEADENATISCWIDDSLADYYTASQLLKIEALTAFSSSSTGYTLAEVTELSMAISSGYSGYTMTLQKATLNPESGFAGDNNYKIMTFAMAGALLIIGVFLIVRYRLFGVSSFISILGCFGLMFFVLTNFYAYVGTRQITMASFGAFLIILFLSFSVAVREAEGIRSSKSNSFAKSVNEGFSRNTGTSLFVFGSVFLVGLLMSDVFRRTGGWTTTIIQWVMPSFTAENYLILGQFGTMLWTGAIFAMLTVVFANRLMAKSIAGIKNVEKTSFFGGKADEKL